jgi:hypothetical protein
MRPHAAVFSARNPVPLAAAVSTAVALPPHPVGADERWICEVRGDGLYARSKEQGGSRKHGSRLLLAPYAQGVGTVLLCSVLVLAPCMCKGRARAPCACVLCVCERVAVQESCSVFVWLVVSASWLCS